MMLNASATVAALTDARCGPNTIVWSFDAYVSDVIRIIAECEQSVSSLGND